MNITLVNSNDLLPLTCSRKGTCCHGNQVLLNPWEIAVLANGKNCSPQEFINTYTDLGGIRLKFDGATNSLGKKACNLYTENFGCSIHPSRPLACRLFPLGRQIQNNVAQYMFQGDQFPCLKECSEVLNLPKLSVKEYLSGQQTETFEKAQDGYLEMMQNIADIAFTLLLDTGLAASGDTTTLKEWKKLGAENPEKWVNRIPADWYEVILFPEINYNPNECISFIEKHSELIQLKTQEKFENQLTLEEYSYASIQLMAITLLLAKSIGADTEVLIELWIQTAKENGALE